MSDKVTHRSNNKSAFSSDRKRHNFLSFVMICCVNAMMVFNLNYTATSYYSYSSLDLSSSIEFWPVFIALSMWQFWNFKLCQNTPSTIVVGIFNFCLISPVVLLPFFTRFALTSNTMPILTLLISIHIIILISNMSFRGLILKSLKMDELSFRVTLAVLLIIGIYQLISNFGNMMSADWASMYDRRLLAREIFSQNITLRYYNSFFGAVLIPFCALYGAAYRSWGLVALAFCGAALSFAAFGGKGVFFSPLLGVLLGLYFKRTIRLNFFSNITFLILLFLALCSVEIVLTDAGILNWYAFRRMFYVPADLTYQYWEYFSNNPVYLMSDSLFGSLFGGSDQVYSKARLIGGVYYGKYIMNANVNVFGTAFGDFGLIGIPIVAVLVGLICRLLNGIYRIKNSIIVVAYTVFVALVWTQGGFHTSFLSNGLIFSLILLMIVPRVKEATKL